MISARPIEKLLMIAKAGGSLRVDGKKYPAEHLRTLAMNLTPNAVLEICNSTSIPTDHCARIASSSKQGKILFL